MTAAHAIRALPAVRSQTLERLLSTKGDVGPLVLRAMLGIVMLPHGAQKVLGLFGGGGIDGTLAFFSDVFHVPPTVTVLVPGWTRAVTRARRC
jgi:predicted ribosomally synthesized peptide with SipW-like signal peptide